MFTFTTTLLVSRHCLVMLRNPLHRFVATCSAGAPCPDRRFSFFLQILGETSSRVCSFAIYSKNKLILEFSILNLWKQVIYHRLPFFPIRLQLAFVSTFYSNLADFVPALWLSSTVCSCPRRSCRKLLTGLFFSIYDGFESNGN